MADETPQTPNPAETFQRLLAQKNNDATALASQLFDENFQLRVKNRELKDAGPKEGAKVLSPDEAKRWDAYEALGKEPKDLRKAIDALPELEKTNKELAGMETLRELADIGLDGSKLKLSVLKDQMLTKYPDAAITFKTEKNKDGVEVKTAYIKPTADGPESSFHEFAAQNLSDYLPALKVTAEATPVIPGNTHDPKPQGGPLSTFDRLRSKLTEERKANAVPIVDLDARFGRPAQTV